MVPGDWISRQLSWPVLVHTSNLLVKNLIILQNSILHRSWTPLGSNSLAPDSNTLSLISQIPYGNEFVSLVDHQRIGILLQIPLIIFFNVWHFQCQNYVTNNFWHNSQSSNTSLFSYFLMKTCSAWIHSFHYREKIKLSSSLPLQ